MAEGAEWGHSLRAHQVGLRFTWKSVNNCDFDSMFSVNMFFYWNLINKDQNIYFFNLKKSISIGYDAYCFLGMGTF